jgi:hypothetical protein
MNKKTLFLIILTTVLILPFGVLATTDDTATDGITVCVEGETSIPCIMESIINTALYIASGIVVILWVVTGILFLIAQGAPEKLGLARKSLFASIIGTVLVIIASSALSLVESAIGF